MLNAEIEHFYFVLGFVRVTSPNIRINGLAEGALGL
jgi:hypothetical protein